MIAEAFQDLVPSSPGWYTLSLTDNYGIGSYRYIHYTAYTKENRGKILDGTIGEYNLSGAGVSSPR